MSSDPGETLGHGREAGQVGKHQGAVEQEMSLLRLLRPVPNQAGGVGKEVGHLGDHGVSEGAATWSVRDSGFEARIL